MFLKIYKNKGFQTLIFLLYFICKIKEVKDEKVIVHIKFFCYFMHGH